MAFSLELCIFPRPAAISHLGWGAVCMALAAFQVILPETIVIDCILINFLVSVSGCALNTPWHISNSPHVYVLVPSVYFSSLFSGRVNMLTISPLDLMRAFIFKASFLDIGWAQLRHNFSLKIFVWLSLKASNIA